MGANGQTQLNGSGKRPKGRPKGSRNKPKQPPTILHVSPTLPISLSRGPNPNGRRLPVRNLAKPNSSTITKTKHYQRLRGKAETALEKLVSDVDTPSNVRVASARILLELVGAIGAKAPKHEQEQGLEDEGLEPETLSLADIERMIAETR